MRRIITMVILMGLCIFWHQNVLAEEKPLWEAGIGAGFLQMPDYRGSDESRYYLLPYPYVVYRGGLLKIEEQRVSGQLFKSERVFLDLSGYGSVPVKSSNNSARTGMPDLDPTFEVGPSLRIKLLNDRASNLRVTLAMPVRAFFSTNFSSVRREGWIFSPRLNLEKDDIIPATGLNLGISTGPMFVDSSYNNYFYEVETAYATSSRPAYSAGGGYSGTTLTLGLSKTYEKYIISAFVSADFLRGAVFEDSPLVKTKTSIMSGLSVSWIFFKSAKTVPSDK